MNKFVFELLKSFKHHKEILIMQLTAYFIRTFYLKNWSKLPILFKFFLIFSLLLSILLNSIVS